MQQIHWIFSKPDKSPEFMIFKILTACEKGIQYFAGAENATHHWTQTRHVLKAINFLQKYSSVVVNEKIK